MSNLLENQQSVFVANITYDHDRRTVNLPNWASVQHNSIHVYFGYVRYNTDNEFYVDVKSYFDNKIIDQTIGPMYLSRMDSPSSYVWFDIMGQPRFFAEFFHTEAEVKRFLMKKRLLDYKISTGYIDYLGNLRQL